MTEKRRKPGRPTKRTPERAKLIADGLRRGLPMKHAAWHAEISPRTVYEWQAADEDFRAACEMAIAEADSEVIVKFRDMFIDQDNLTAGIFYAKTRIPEMREPKEQPVVIQLPEGAQVDLGAAAMHLIREGMKQGASPAAIKTGVDSLLAAANTADRSELARELRKLVEELEGEAD